MSKYIRAVLIFLSLIASSNAFASIREIKPGNTLELQANEGLIVLVVDNVIALDYITLSSEDHKTNYKIPKPAQGKTFKLLVATQGIYTWSEFSLFNLRMQIKRTENYRFTVKPGMINYAGDMIFNHDGPGYRANRGLASIDWMNKNYPALTKLYTFEYSGDYPDPFPAFYRQQVGDSSLVVESQSKAIPVTPKLPISTDLLWRTDRIHSIQLSPDASYISETYNLGADQQELNIIDMKSGEITIYAKVTDIIDLTWVSKNAFVLSTRSSQYGSVARFIQITATANGKLSFQTTNIPRAGYVIDPLLSDPEFFLFATGARTKADTAYVFKLSKTDPDSLKNANNYIARNRANISLENDWAWITDATGEIIAALVIDGKKWTLVLKNGKTFKPVRELPHDGSFKPLAISPDRKTLFAVTDEGRNQVDLVKMDLETGANVETVYSKAGVDMQNVILDANRQPIGVQYYVDGQVKSEYFDQSAENLNKQLSKAFPDSSIIVIDRDQSNNFVLLYVDSSDNPGSVYLFDTQDKRVEKIDDFAPWLGKWQFGKSHVLKTTVKDGLAIESYLTIPAKMTGTSFPLVVMPHGGPIGIRDYRHFDRNVQFLASLGVAVLQVNFRGSEGYGKKFMEAGKGSFGTAIEDDIDAALGKALAQYPLDKSRMCVFGTSYGGYSALVSSVRWPDRFRCTISLSGVSDRILNFTASDTVRRIAERKWMEDYFGNPLTDLENMKSRQPLYMYKQLKSPVMLIHGTNDLRVDYEHAFRLQRMLTLAGNPPVMLTLKDEGHGLNSDENIKIGWEAIAGFLTLHLSLTEEMAAGEKAPERPN